MIHVTIFSVSDDVSLFFLHFEAIVSYLKLSAHKEQPNNLSFEYAYKKMDSSASLL